MFVTQCQGRCSLHLTSSSKTTEGLRWEGTSGDHLPQSPSNSNLLQSVAQGSATQGLNTFKIGDPNIYLGNLYQCFSSLRLEKGFFLSLKNCFLYLCSLSLVLTLGSTEKSLPFFSLNHPRKYLYTLTKSNWAFSSLT